MAEFQTQVGGMRPFTGKRYYFESKSDIATYELACILKVVSEQTGSASLAGPLKLSNGIDADLARHFRVEEH